MAIPKPGSPVRGSSSGRPIMALLDLLGRRWTLRILWEMRVGEPLSFRDIQATCDDISPTSLNKRLQELKALQIIQLNPVHGYELTEIGKSLIEAFLPLNDWAKTWEEVLKNGVNDEDND